MTRRLSIPPKAFGVSKADLGGPQGPVIFAESVAYYVRFPHHHHRLPISQVSTFILGSTVVWRDMDDRRFTCESGEVLERPNRSSKYLTTHNNFTYRGSQFRYGFPQNSPSEGHLPTKKTFRLLLYIESLVDSVKQRNRSSKNPFCTGRTRL